MVTRVIVPSDTRYASLRSSVSSGVSRSGVVNTTVRPSRLTPPSQRETLIAPLPGVSLVVVVPVRA